MTEALTGYTVNTIQDLKNIPVEIRSTGYIKAVNDTHNLYQFNKDSTEVADGINIISPTLGSGRWYKMNSFTEPILQVGQELYLVNLPYTVYQSSQFDNGSGYIAPFGTYNLFNDKNTNTGSATGTNLSEEYIIADLGEPRFVSQHIFGGGYIKDNNGIDIIDVGSYLNNCTLYASSDSLNWIEISTVTGIQTSNNLYSIFNVPLNSYRYWKLENTSGIDKNIAISEWRIRGIATSNETTQEVEIKVDNLASNTNQILEKVVPSTFNVIEIKSNYPARVRIYLTNTLAVSDISRLNTVEINPDLGCLLDNTFSSENESVYVIPSIYAYTLTDTDYLYFSIDNLDSVARDINIKLIVRLNKNYDINYTQTTNILYNMLFN